MQCFAAKKFKQTLEAGRYYVSPNLNINETGLLQKSLYYIFNIQIPFWYKPSQNRTKASLQSPWK